MTIQNRHCLSSFNVSLKRTLKFLPYLTLILILNQTFSYSFPLLLFTLLTEDQPTILCLSLTNEEHWLRRCKQWWLSTPRRWFCDSQHLFSATVVISRVAQSQHPATIKWAFLDPRTPRREAARTSGSADDGDPQLISNNGFFGRRSEGRFVPC